MYRETHFQALCFGEPIEPWRRSRARAQEDLVAHNLGSYDEWGRFYMTVPGDLRRKDAWVEAEQAA